MKKEVFIIDDDPILRLIVKKMIHNIDSSVICHQFENGEKGIVAMGRFSHTNNPVIVLLDINMPILDGWGFLDRLNEMNLDGYKNIQLCIVSSSINESDILKASQYNLVRKFLHKPLNKEDIVEILNGN